MIAKCATIAVVSLIVFIVIASSAHAEPLTAYLESWEYNENSLVCSYSVGSYGFSKIYPIDSSCPMTVSVDI